MAFLRWLLGLGAAVAAHVLLLRFAPAVAPMVDPFLLLVVLQSLGRDPAWCMLGGAAIGLSHDALTGGLFGLYGVADTVTALVTARLQQRFMIQQPAQIGLLVAMAAALELVLLAALQLLFLARPELPQPWVAVVRMVASGFLGLLLHLMGQRVLRTFFRWRRVRQRKLTLEAR